MNILIGTPAYNGQVQIDYLNSILDFHKEKLPVSVMCIGNESLITRGRNTILSYFYNMTDFSHLLFLDADMGLSADGLKRLLLAEKDVIGAAVALKGYDKDGNPVYNVGNNLGTEDDLVKTDKLGTAVFMLSRKAVESLVSDAKEKGDTYSGNPYSRGDKHSMTHYDVFKTGVVDSQYLSEDFYVCNTLMKLGYTIYVDVTIKTRHNGMYIFGGD